MVPPSFFYTPFHSSRHLALSCPIQRERLVVGDAPQHLLYLSHCRTFVDQGDPSTPKPPPTVIVPYLAIV